MKNKKKERRHDHHRLKKHYHDDANRWSKQDQRDIDLSLEKEDVSYKQRKKSRKKHEVKKQKKPRSYTRDEGNKDSSSISNEISETDHETSKKRKRYKRMKSSRKHKRDDAKGFRVPPFISAIQKLFDKYPHFSSELPYLLIKLGNQECLDISQMSPSDLGESLGSVFHSLGCTKNAKKGWEWKENERFDQLLNFSSKSNSGSGRQCIHKMKLDRELVLIKMAERLLDALEITTLDAVQSTEGYSALAYPINMTRQNEKESEVQIQGIEIAEIKSLMLMLLNKFDWKGANKNASTEISLAKELFELTNAIMNEEMICLDGIENHDLKESLGKLFSALGLVKGEIDNHHEETNNYERDINNGNNEDTFWGYSLPEDKETKDYAATQRKLEMVMSECKSYHQKRIQKKGVKRTLGPTMPTENDMTKSIDTVDFNDDATVDSDNEGPLPLGNQRARKPERKKIDAKLNIADSNMAKKCAREEWMSSPGEHDFLKGVMSSSVLKNRSFKNEKTTHEELDDTTLLNPQIQKQIDTVLQAHVESRGASLMQQHKEAKALKKVEVSTAGGKWKWNRDDLDHGRRVDKQFLKMVMGGAETELKNKFHGEYSKE